MKILIIGPSWIGDSIMSQSLYRLLLKNNQNTKIDIVTPNWNQSLFSRMPEIRKILPLPSYKHGSFPVKQYYKFAKLLKKYEQYQQSIILPNSFKSGLIPFFAKIPKRTGWKGEMRYGIINDMRILNKKNFPLMIQRYATLALEKDKIKTIHSIPTPLLWPHIHCSPQETQNTSKKFNIKQNKKKIIGICPGAGLGLNKCWPAYHYANLTRQLIQQEYQIILLGSYKEKYISEIINNQLPKNLQIYCNNLIGLTSIDEAISIINKCDAIISNDSGLMHIACALQRPVIGIYGPTDPNFTPPLYTHVKIIKNNNNTHYSHKIKEKMTYTHKYHPSLENIQPEQVLKELKILL